MHHFVENEVIIGEFRILTNDNKQNIERFITNKFPKK
jgi:hypothetical protein